MAESEKAPKPTDATIETIEKPKSRSLQELSLHELKSIAYDLNKEVSKLQYIELEIQKRETECKQ